MRLIYNTIIINIIVLLLVDCSPTNRERELGLDRRETG
jgi:hypothetical protein